MKAPDAADYRVLRERARRLAAWIAQDCNLDKIRVDAALVDLDDFREMFQVGEYQLGLETLCEQMLENDIVCSSRVLDDIADLAVVTGMDPVYVRRLAALAGR
jgi:hypothetical protein